MRTVIFFVAVLFIIFTIPEVFAQFSSIEEENMIVITKSQEMSKVIFDGKWSFKTEWKESSWKLVQENESTAFHLRAAHQDDFIYFQINVTPDTKADFDVDKSIICIDTKNNKSEFLDDDDYCFVVRLQESNFFENLFGEMNSEILQVKSSAKTFDELEQITSNEFIGIGTMSDEQDRYSSTPHATYEFKIPTDLVGRSDNYGILFLVFDSDTNSTYSWPENPEFTINEIPSPTKWGDMISPDKSLPEFNIPMLIILSSIIMITIISRLKLSHISR